jgi:hypothetical protein
MFRHCQNAIIRDWDMNMLRWCTMSWKARKDGSCVCNRRRNIPTITSSVTIYSSHSSLLFTISACSYLTTWWWHFENAETCRSILSTNTLNEWCIYWFFTHYLMLSWKLYFLLVWVIHLCHCAILLLGSKFAVDGFIFSEMPDHTQSIINRADWCSWIGLD